MDCQRDFLLKWDGVRPGAGVAVALLGTRRTDDLNPASSGIPGEKRRSPLAYTFPRGLTEFLITWAEPMFSFPVVCSFFHPDSIGVTYLFQTVALSTEKLQSGIHCSNPVRPERKNRLRHSSLSVPSRRRIRGFGLPLFRVNSPNSYLCEEAWYTIGMADRNRFTMFPIHSEPTTEPTGA